MASAASPQWAGNLFREISGDIRWSLAVAIPLKTFFRQKIDTLAGRSFKAKFCKCGDKLSNPQIVTWKPVGTEKPDYHRPNNLESGSSFKLINRRSASRMAQPETHMVNP
ncbi:MAG: carbohydrate-binding family 9-like protein [Bacteroidales bacterium]|nr:carbohydrate-binding family 9-like protein [Bacteroidales bacterium]